ncbi:hypothetical protein [Natronorubrum tibetense]|uniref:Uncharacterized protein n=1 Tax=Natronorubrum tibetense GA33 TaxID=1114856 RepID=L9VTW5_9EURY|nr:hypothetical protein [Natronorubrum tibetense]ELY40471.1 hypothetical protein C496_11498 [Natronorubrum tibetense GA33]
MSDPNRTPALGIGLGIALVAVGIGAYVLSDFASVTALIPAVFGVAIAVLGVVGWQTDRQRLAIYGIGALALLGVLGSARGIPDVVALLTRGAVESTVAAVAQGSMILIGLVLLVAVGRDLRNNSR